jgi:hypothetical protein
MPSKHNKRVEKKKPKKEQNHQAWHEKAGLSDVHMYKQNLMLVVASRKR